MASIPQPFPFQAECLNEIDWFDGRSLVALEPGLGKTLVSLFWASRERGRLPMAVVCPASVKYVWERECRRLGMKSAVLSGRGLEGRIRADVVIVNYDVLYHRLPDLKAFGSRTVALDECHLIANQSKRSKAAKDLCRRIPYVLGLSGTPLVNWPIELHTILSILYPKRFGGRFAFAKEFCAPRWTPWGWRYDGAANLDLLHELLVSTCMVRRRKADVLKDLPAKLRDEVPVELVDRAEYGRAEADFLAWLRGIDPAAAKRAGRAEAMARTGRLLALAAKLKMPAVAGWIADKLAEDGDKIVVFCRHKAAIAYLLERFPSSAVVDGSVPQAKREGMVRRFRDDPRCRLFLGNLQAAGTGMDGLQGVSSTMAMAETWWSPGTMVQAEDRLHRIGATDTVWCHYLVAHGTIEEKLQRVVAEKQAVLNQVLDGGMIDVDSDTFDQFISEVRR